jgi:hypothetical protein
MRYSMKATHTTLVSLGVGTLLTLGTTAFGDTPGKHPGYLHALSDLRAARFLIEHRPGDPAVTAKEDEAIREIEKAISDIKKASIDDGKDLNDHPPVDAPHDRPGRLNAALEDLRKAREDVNHEEDDPAARGLKEGSLRHIDAATGNVKEALAHK